MSQKGKSIKSKGISLRTVGLLISTVTVIISAALISSIYLLSGKYNDVNNSTQNYMAWKSVATDIQLASDYLTDQVRSFVVVGKKKYMDGYFEESKVTKRREKALEVLEKNLQGTDVISYVTNAIQESMDLMKDEYYAMRLVSDVEGVDYSGYQEIKDVVITPEDLALNDDQKLIRSIDIVYGEQYNTIKDKIYTNINKATSTLDTMMEQNVINSSKDLRVILIVQQAMILLNIVFLVGLLFIMYFNVIKPANDAVKALKDDSEMHLNKIKEFSYLADTYNEIHMQNKHVKERLIYEAEHDKLTGLFNRTGYDSIYRRINLDKTIYILIDCDKFKDINDQYGHSVGDKVLIKVADTLNKHFGQDENSYIFRIGGDEFSIIIEKAENRATEDIVETFNIINNELGLKEGDIPGISVSVGIARGKGADTTDTLFRKADKALYRVKKQGRHDVSVAE